MAVVLITDGNERATLAAARSLGRAGHRVLICAQRTPSLAGASRYALAEAAVPDPLAEADGFVSEVARLAERWHADVLLPVTEAALLALLPSRDRLGGIRIPFPDAHVFRRVCDKAQVLAIAREIGIATPEQVVVERPADVQRRIALVPTFPVFVKPSRSVYALNGRRCKAQVRPASDLSALRAALAALPPEAFPVLIQQRVQGPGVGVFLLLWQGDLVARFCHRRLREKPPCGGVSVYRESVEPDAELVWRSRKLLERLGWEGIAMIEYKRDAKSGTPYLMEVNGRLWGSLQLAIDAGVDFPALLVRAALGRAVEPVLDYRAGVRCRWWWGDVDQLLARLRARGVVPGGDARRRDRWRALVEFVWSWRPGETSETFRLTDPGPFVRESLDWLRRGG